MTLVKSYPVAFSPSLDPERGEALTDFCFPWLEKPAPRTEFRAVYDDSWLVFRFEVEDEDLVIAESEDPGEGALGSDRVELFFSPSTDLRPHYFGAEMDPSGRVFDYRAVHHRQFDPSWSFSSLAFAGAITPGGYRVDGRIELGELRDLGLLRDGRLVAGVYRAEFSHFESGIREDWISWVSPDSPTPDFHVPSSFGQFQFLSSDA